MTILSRIVLALMFIVGMSIPAAPHVAVTIDSVTPQCGIFPSQVSDVGVEFIKEHEAFRANAYQDQSETWTIGYGFTRWRNEPVTADYPGPITQRQADAEFARQLGSYEAIVRRSVCSLVAQHSYDSLVSLAWNLGRINTRLVEKLSEHGTQDVEKADFLSTATVRGQRVPGLVTRRMREYHMFIGLTQ